MSRKGAGAWSSGDVGDWRGRSVVITGANSGVGLEAARVLAHHGARVVLACRDPQRAEQARLAVGSGASGSAEVVALDLADLDSVARCAEIIADTVGVLDVLVANAGVMGGRVGVTEQGFERQMATNHLAHAALVARLWPLVRERVVVLSSIAARGGALDVQMTRETLVEPPLYDAQQVYSNSKQANLLFAQELHRRASAAGSPVRVVAAHPGVAHTNLFMRQLSDQGRPWLVPIARPVLAVLFQSAAAGALPTLRAASDPAVGSGAFVGPRYMHQVRGRPVCVDVYPSARDPRVAARLWDLTESLIQVPLPFS